MICTECRKGGEWNSDASALPETDPHRQHYFYMAREAHSMCKSPGKGCFCQHGVGAGWIVSDTVRATS